MPVAQITLCERVQRTQCYERVEAKKPPATKKKKQATKKKTAAKRTKRTKSRGWCHERPRRQKAKAGTRIVEQVRIGDDSNQTDAIYRVVYQYHDSTTSTMAENEVFIKFAKKFDDDDDDDDDSNTLRHEIDVYEHLAAHTLPDHIAVATPYFPWSRNRPYTTRTAANTTRLAFRVNDCRIVLADMRFPFNDCDAAWFLVTQSMVYRNEWTIVKAVRQQDTDAECRMRTDAFHAINAFVDAGHVMHNDLKDDNLLVRPSAGAGAGTGAGAGAGFEFCFFDFGISVRIDDPDEWASYHTDAYFEFNDPAIVQTPRDYAKAFDCVRLFAYRFSAGRGRCLPAPSLGAMPPLAAMYMRFVEIVEPNIHGHNYPDHNTFGLRRYIHQWYTACIAPRDSACACLRRIVTRLRRRA